jgi:hypothetical protein
MSDKIGVINEIGDMGLGFDELSEADQKLYKSGSLDVNRGQQPKSSVDKQKSTTTKH